MLIILTVTARLMKTGEELEQRKKTWTQQPLKVSYGAPAKYARLGHPPPMAR